MIALKWTAVVVGGIALFAFVLALIGQARWRGLTEDLSQRLQAARINAEAARFDPRELDGLPAPVQRYLRAALSEGTPIVAAATIRHTGSFNMSEAAEQWVPFGSIQHVITRRPGFVWDARVRMVHGIAVHVHDAYVAGVGETHPAVLGLWSIGRLRDTESLANAALMRFLAEAAWYPTALLPSQGVRWRAIDEQSADATLNDGPQSVTLRFRFGGDGLIESIRAEARGRMVGGKLVPTPWEGRWFDYRLQDGMRVPVRGEVGWMLPGGVHPYWCGTIRSIEYEHGSIR